LRAELASVFIRTEHGIPHNPDSHMAHFESMNQEMASSPFFSNHPQALNVKECRAGFASQRKGVVAIVCCASLSKGRQQEAFA
jgi:hypothetical protein